MAALIALSERKRVSYDVLHRLSTVDILYAENRKKKRSHVKYMDFMFLFFPSRKNYRHFYFVLIAKLRFSRVNLR